MLLACQKDLIKLHNCQFPKKEKTQEMGMVFCFGILIFN